MKIVFADACYWIALLHRNDQLHANAYAARTLLSDAQVVTTDEVLTEVLNFFSKWSGLRTIAVETVEAIRQDKRVRVVEQSRSSFDQGLALYKSRPDKGFSLTDCISFDCMRKLGIDGALTDDHHFVQAGYTALLRRPE